MLPRRSRPNAASRSRKSPAEGRTHMDDKKIRVTLVKSTNGCKKEHRATVRGLGLRRLRQTPERKETPQVARMNKSRTYPGAAEGANEINHPKSPPRPPTPRTPAPRP